MALIALKTEVDTGRPVTQKANQVEPSGGSISVLVPLYNTGTATGTNLPIVIMASELSGAAKAKLEEVITDILRFRGFIL